MYERTSKPRRLPPLPTAVLVTLLCALFAALMGAGGYAMTQQQRAPQARPAQPTTAPTRLNVLNWNICGEAGGLRGQRGFCPNRNRPDLTVAEIKAMVAERHADVVTLQEVCGGAPGSHLTQLEAALEPGWTVMRARGTRPDGASECRGSLTGELGVAVAVRGTIVSSVSGNTLTDDPSQSDGQVSPLLCVDVEGWSHRICTTHLLPSNDKRGAEQVTRIAERISPDGKPYVLTGDFNRNSKSLDLVPLTTTLTECKALTQDEETTHHAWDSKGGKHVYRTLDHVFVSRGRDGTKAALSGCGVDRSRMDTTPNEEDTPPNGKSDHAPVYVTVRINR
ncbi:endonuclease/exonuclease/phosphatase family protein [Streptomyces sp. NPDC088762]|uniref:endonuclease/exonuclease/phosphatase family protein n=1 Tax=Streptomyces sp. NPDC088762 TaxID=3365891 RepID=UPI00382474EA